jgi:hypothetical protein
MNEDELEIQHRTLIEEEELEVSSLPTEIKNAMRKFNMKLAKYEDSGDEELFYELQQDDVAIADNILTFIEDNNSDDEDEDEDYLEEQREKEQEQEKEKEQEKIEVKNEEPAKQVNPVNNLEEQIKALVKNGKISVSDLENIIKREPDYPNEQVGNLILKKVYLQPYYEVYQK